MGLSKYNTRLNPFYSLNKICMVNTNVTRTLYFMTFTFIVRV